MCVCVCVSNETTMTTDLDSWYAISSWHDRGQMSRPQIRKIHCMEENFSRLCVQLRGDTRPVWSWNCTQVTAASIVCICPVLCAKKFGATSSEGFLASCGSRIKHSYTVWYNLLLDASIVVRRPPVSVKSHIQIKPSSTWLCVTVERLFHDLRLRSYISTIVSGVL